jgi:MYXO-CTERM domain-containing protein
MTATQVLSMFTAIDGTPLVNSSFTGLFSGNDTTTLAAYAPGFQSAQAYFLVGNNATLANSSLIAVYATPGQVYTPPVAGIANVAINGNVAGNWVYGTQTAVTVQPVTLSGAAFTTGIQLIASPVPEPSAAFLGALGALGLLRRRRN